MNYDQFNNSVFFSRCLLWLRLWKLTRKDFLRNQSNCSVRYSVRILIITISLWFIYPKEYCRSEIYLCRLWKDWHINDRGLNFRKWLLIEVLDFWKRLGKHLRPLVQEVTNPWSFLKYLEIQVHNYFEDFWRHVTTLESARHRITYKRPKYCSSQRGSMHSYLVQWGIRHPQTRMQFVFLDQEHTISENFRNIYPYVIRIYRKKECFAFISFRLSLISDVYTFHLISRHHCIIFSATYHSILSQWVTVWRLILFEHQVDSTDALPGNMWNDILIKLKLRFRTYREDVV